MNASKCNNCNGTSKDLWQSEKHCKDRNGNVVKHTAATLCNRCLKALRDAGLKMQQSY